MMFCAGAEGARAELRLVTPKRVFAEIPLHVGPTGIRKDERRP
jgi:hypothetical protein